MNERTTVVVVTWRGRAHITACLDALAAQTRPHRILVVDNASTDGTADLLAAHPAAPTVRRLGVNLGYAGALAVVGNPGTQFAAWLNDDAAPEPDWLAHLEDALDANPRAAAASALLIAPDGGVQSAGVRLTRDGHGADSTAGRVFGFCGGAALVRCSALVQVGGVPGDFFCYYEDTDTSWRMRLAGWDVLSVPAARAAHLHGASTEPGSPDFHRWNERNRLLMLLRCAPLRVALTQVFRFVALTAVLPLRGRQEAHNFRVGLRLRVLAELGQRVPRALAARKRLPIATDTSRTRVWRDWAGR